MPTKCRSGSGLRTSAPSTKHPRFILERDWRLKLKATIIVNDTEFNHAGEMSVDDRHLYHEALEAVFPPGIAVPATDGQSVTEERKVAHRKVLLVVAAAVSVLVGAIYLWLHGLFG